MGTMLRNESRRLYSWWWDSHNSPKNSKWLQENLTDMDAKVKAMIKLIEEDADSFARRAEMYYKKRPELMKLVEEFYRAYRALAERYDHATVELRHAHRTMSQAFPDQAIPFSLGEESQSCSSGPENHAVLGNSSEVSDSATSKRGLKQLSEIFGSEGCGQNFEEVDSETERALRAETEVESLKKTLAKVQAEKDSLLLQFQQNVEKLKSAERDLSLAQGDVGRLDEQATEAETEIKILKKSLSDLEEERDSGLLQINDFLVKITSLEIRLSQAQDEGKGNQKRAVIAESESNSLRQELSRLEAEKESGLVRYRNCLERISDLESKIALSEEKARLLGEQVRNSEAEIEALKRALAKMTEEKEAAELQYKHCLEVISMMESEISRAQANAERLSNEILLGAEKLKSAEDQLLGLESSNQALRSEADSLLDKISEKDRELSEKSRELKKFQSLVVEESSKFHQVESTLQALRKLHSQSQEDQRALASELKDGLRMLRDVEICKHGMEEEIQRVKDENKSLSELNVSSSLSVKTLQDEIFSLKEMRDRLENEFARKEDQSEALKNEIGGLKEEINGLKNRYFLILKQVDSAGLSPESLGSAVKDLRDENSKLRELFNRESEEKKSLYLKVNDSNKLSSENTLLRDSMSGLTFELEDLRDKATKLQESCHSLEGEKWSLVAEKSSLLSQLQIITENMQKLFEKNSSLESSLTGANSDLEQVRMRTQSLDDLCKTLDEEKSGLLNERNSLVAQLEKVEKRLGRLETRFTKLEEKYSDLEKERESAVNQVEELRGSLVAEKRSSEIRFADLRNDVTVLQEETKLGKKEFEEELDRAVNAQIEIFILQKFVEDLEEKNFSLVNECQKHAEAKKFSDKLISELESENLEQQVEAEFLVNEIEKLRLGIQLVFRALRSDSKLEQEQVSVRSILEDIEDLKSSVSMTEDEEQKLLVENSVLLALLAQMRDNGSGLESEKLSLEREFEIMKCHYRSLQKDKENLLDLNMDLRSEVNEREIREEKLKLKLEDIHVKMVNLQWSYIGLKEQNSKILEENRLLLKKLSSLEGEKGFLEEQNDAIVHEAVALNTFSLVLESFAAEKVTELKVLSRDLNALSEANNDLKEETRMLRENMANKEAESVRLNDSVEILGNELIEVKDSNDQLILQVSLEKDILKVKSIELSEADEKIKATECLNEKLSLTVEELNIECEELKLHRQILEEKILEMNEESFDRNKKLERLNESKDNLETRVGVLCKELEEHKIREESLSSELLEKCNESELWEAEASGFYFDLQISAVREVLLESKVNELVGVCESLEEERSSKSAEIEKIRDKVNLLENHIGKLEAKLSAYVPVVASLRENVASLEHNARLKAKLLEATNQAQKVHRREKSGEELRLCQTTEIPDGIWDLQKMQKTIKAVEKAMVEEIEKLAIEAVGEEAEKLAAQETKISNNKNRNNLNVVLEKPENDKSRTRNDKSRLRNDNNLMKDIQLDQVSDLSLYGRSKRETPGPADPMLELWDTRSNNEDESIINNKAAELTDDAIEPRSRRASSKLSSSQNSISSSELQLEKELGVDKLERKRGNGHKARILERLASDSQKLTNLQRSVSDLKKKIETTTTIDDNKGKNYRYQYNDVSEFESVQRHILEVEESVSQLVEVNGSLVKDVEESQLVRDGKSVTEQARKGAEKIGQLQFEVQNINYILMKLGTQGEKTKVKGNRFTGVLLKDFIYSSRRKRQKRKKGCLCCANPKTRED